MNFVLLNPCGLVTVIVVVSLIGGVTLAIYQRPALLEMAGKIRVNEVSRTAVLHSVKLTQPFQ